MPSKIPAVFRAAVSAAALGAIGYYLWYGLTDRGTRRCTRVPGSARS